MLGCKRLKGHLGTPLGLALKVPRTERLRQEAGTGHGEACSGASVLDTSQRHLPLNIRILSMVAKVAVTLDSKSPSCTPVFRKAPAVGLFSQ